LLHAPEKPQAHGDYDRSKTLEVTADLKATQIAQDIDLYRDLAQAVSTRSEIQALLKAYRDGNRTIGPALENEVGFKMQI
jgi:hypothetical protein